MIVYIHNKCSTCQNALRYLEGRKITFTVRDIVQNPPSLKELQQMLVFQKGQLKKLLNTSGLLYREMHLTDKIPIMSEKQVLELLSNNGMLIKRPFVLGENSGLVGFKTAEWEVFLN